MLKVHGEGGGAAPRSRAGACPSAGMAAQQVARTTAATLLFMASGPSPEARRSLGRHSQRRLLTEATTSYASAHLHVVVKRSGSRHRSWNPRRAVVDATRSRRWILRLGRALPATDQGA